mmetsp:Transcript_19255/g.18507  ORF Transcript_19255/g.18507 Transcript_19255/m.18507 type:complete len:200 (+) Transcript_19255:511-1110(+)
MSTSSQKSLSASGCSQTLVIRPTRISRAVIDGPSYVSIGSIVAGVAASATVLTLAAADFFDDDLLFSSVVIGDWNSSGIVSQNAFNFTILSSNDTTPTSSLSTTFPLFPTTMASKESCFVTSCPLISPVKARRSGWNKFFPLTFRSFDNCFMYALYASEYEYAVPPVSLSSMIALLFTSKNAESRLDGSGCGSSPDSCF